MQYSYQKCQVGNKIQVTILGDGLFIESFSNNSEIFTDAELIYGIQEIDIEEFREICREHKFGLRATSLARPGSITQGL